MSADEPSIELIFDSSEPEFQVGAGLGLNYYNDITVGVINLTPTNIKLITAVAIDTNKCYIKLFCDKRGTKWLLMLILIYIGAYTDYGNRGFKWMKL